MSRREKEGASASVCMSLDVGCSGEEEERDGDDVGGDVVVSSSPCQEEFARMLAS